MLELSRNSCITSYRKRHHCRSFITFTLSFTFYFIANLCQTIWLIDMFHNNKIRSVLQSDISHWFAWTEGPTESHWIFFTSMCFQSSRPYGPPQQLQYKSKCSVVFNSCAWCISITVSIVHYKQLVNSRPHRSMKTSSKQSKHRQNASQMTAPSDERAGLYFVIVPCHDE